MLQQATKDASDPTTPKMHINIDQPHEKDINKARIEICEGPTYF